MKVCYNLKDIINLSSENLNNVHLKLTPGKSFSLKICMRLTFLQC